VTKHAVAFVSGLLFAAGLSVAGMTQPGKVLAFLDVTGAWDPSLALVMVGAIGVAAVAFRIAARMRAPIVGDRFHVSDARGSASPRLVAGAALFGVGWGLSGLCPGPAIVSLAGGQLGAVTFVASMLVGLAVVPAVESLRVAPAERLNPR